MKTVSTRAVFQIARFVVLLASVFLAYNLKSFGQHAPSSEKLQFVLIFSRHGVRSPTVTESQLDLYSARPWPKWEVASGELTSHGYRALDELGTYDRLWLTSAGVLPKEGCPENRIYIYSDSDQRTIASGQALAEGLGPHCSIEVHSRSRGEHDTFFHLAGSGVKTATRQEALKTLRVQLHDDSMLPTLANRSTLEEMQRVLEGCGFDAQCSSGVPDPAVQLLQIPSSLTQGSGDRLVDLRGPIAVGSSLAEDFLLEYTNGSPMASVGWGQLDEDRIRSLLRLHTAFFALTHRTQFAAQVEASNLLDHIVRTLNQAITGRRVEGAIGDPGKSVVILVGHDSNLAPLAELLHLSWTLDGSTDDIPPGAELQFLVFKDQKDSARIRLRFVVQTLKQMRHLTPLNTENPPAKANLNVQGCSSTIGECEWEEFRRTAESAINPAFVE